jgi:predicted nucleotidyltransferase
MTDMTTMTLAETLFSRTRSAVLRELLANEDGTYIREMERRTGIDVRQLSRELGALSASGIVTKQRFGNLVIYRFNPECPVYDEIQGLVKKTVGLADVLRRALEPFRDRIQLAYIFGSFARKDQRSDSDVDVMIVGNVTRRELSSATRVAGDILKREINAMVHTPDEYARSAEDSGSFIHAVHTGPRLNLVVDSGRETRRPASERGGGK